MTMMTSRPSTPIGEMLDWLETGGPFGARGPGSAALVRVEDFVEDGVYTVRAELPGIDPDKDVRIELSGDTLVISGERREEQKDKVRHEFRYGSFHRSLTMPAGFKADAITATYENGVLEVSVPLDGEADKTRQIPVKTPGS